MSKKPKIIRSQYDEPNYDGAIAIDASNPEENLTKQSFQDETDVNKLVEKYQRTGQLPDRRGNPQYLDVSDVPDYMEALNRVNAAQAAFAALPAQVRLECGNDPAIFVQRVTQDPEWALKHGLATRRDQPPRQPDPAPEGASPGGQPGPKKESPNTPQG